MKSNLYIAHAPLQGYTTCCYRLAHFRHAGGVSAYYTPFVRLEKGEPRRRDIRDVQPTSCADVPTVPQIIASNVSEFARLCDSLQQMGWSRIDLNMGCPFPMQVRAGRGAGLLLNHSEVESIVGEMRRRPDVVFSVKMRLGCQSHAEGLSVLPYLADAPLEHIVLHPRLATQGYRGSISIDAFSVFYNRCPIPMVLNGDIDSTAAIDALIERFPRLKGFMLGRALLARPWLLCGEPPSKVLRAMHSDVYDYTCRTMQGAGQILPHLHAFWEYQEVWMERKIYKAIMKSTSLLRYDEAVAMLFRSLS